MEMNKIWVDKYRPQKLNEIFGQETFVKRISFFIKSKNLPHLLLCGSPGCGKTTTSLVIANELYGKKNLSGNFLELNASDDRGIDVIRNNIKEFAKLKSLCDIPYKIIYLDEADNLTREAQQALRRTMEKYSNTCRFVLACNQISKILDPIQSRCVIFKFKPLENSELKKLLNKVVKEENLQIEDDAEKFLIEISQGDVRKLLNTLQASCSISSKITKKNLEEVCDFVNPSEIKDMLNFALNKNFLKAKNLLLELLVKKGLTPIEIIKEIYNQVLETEIDESLKLKIIDRLGTIEFRIIEGSDSELQLLSFLSMICLIK